MLIDECVQGLNEFQNAAKNSTAEPVFREVAKETFDHVEPGGTSRREVDMETAMLLQPALNLGVFVSGVIIGDEIEFLAVRRGIVDQSQELDPLLMPVPLLA